LTLDARIFFARPAMGNSVQSTGGLHCSAAARIVQPQRTVQEGQLRFSDEAETVQIRG